MKKHKGKVAVKSLARPTRVFNKTAKKPGEDDRPGPMRGGKQSPPTPPSRTPMSRKKLSRMKI